MLDENGIIIPDTPKKRIQFTAQARRAHVKSYQDGNHTMSAYCDAHDIPVSTFNTWVSKYSRKKALGFIPVRMKSNRTQTKDKAKPCAVQQPIEVPQHKQQRIEIHRGDLKVILSEITDAEMAINSTKEVLSCN